MTMADDSLFVDTNVLLTATDESRPLHSEALNLLSGTTGRDKRLAASGQVVREYLVVATRPIENNGLGLSVADAEANVTEFCATLIYMTKPKKCPGGCANWLLPTICAASASTTPT